MIKREKYYLIETEEEKKKFLKEVKRELGKDYCCTDFSTCPAVVFVTNEGSVIFSSLNEYIPDKGFKVGNYVIVKDNGASYTTYTEWLVKNIVDVNYIAYFCFGEEPKEGRTYRIVMVAPHCNGDNDNILYLIQDIKTRACYIIGEEGLMEKED